MPLLAVRHIQDLHRRFPTNDACLAYLFDLRFSDVTCPECKRRNSYHRHPVQARYTCTCGDSQIYPCKGTLFENSPLPLTKWFYALFFLWRKQGDVKAVELQRKLRVTYTTAWWMMKRMQSAIEETKLGDEYGRFESFLAAVAQCG